MQNAFISEDIVPKEATASDTEEMEKGSFINFEF
jgi:hypothetical protein